MNNIPYELVISINTSIPGYTTLIFKPSMIITNISNDDNTVIFNPLIKLKKSIINKIPEELKKKEFFNKDLFKSLINQTNVTPSKSLNQATYEGNINNNIKLTLETIFSEKSIIYINNKPYIILDFQWSSGDWKIYTKQKKDLKKKEENKKNPKLVYYVTIDLELREGTSISPEEVKNLECNHKWNSVKKTWSKITGNRYSISSVNQNKTLKNKEQKPINKTQYKK